MRPDGRQAVDCRPFQIVPHYTMHAPGSVLVSLGHTKVIVTVSMADRPPRFCQGRGCGWVSAEYAMLPGATHERVARDSSTQRVSGRSSEIQRLIARSMRPTLDLFLLGERHVLIDCDVIQADGGTRTAAILGAMAALRLACAHWVNRGVLSHNPLTALIGAISVGMVQGEARCDLCYEEDRIAQVDLNVVMNDRGEWIEIQGTAESAPYTTEQLITMLELAKHAILPLIDQLKRFPLA